MKTVDVSDGMLIVRFSGENFNENLNLVRNIPNAIFMPKDRYWKLPVLKETVKLFHDNGWDLSEKLKSVLADDGSETVKIDEKKLEGLFPFQIEGVKWLEKKKGMGIVSDEMGLGKTVQAIGYAKLHEDLRPILVVCPASVKINWQREIIKWTHEESEIVYGITPHPLNKNVKWFIINYDIIKDWEEYLQTVGIKAIVIDEAQFISNNSALRTKAIKSLRKSYKSIPLICLSGTPIRNRPSEFFTILNLIAPNVFSNRWKYLNRYCAPYNNGFGWVFNGASNVEELHEMIEPYMIRRQKADVLKDLPAKMKTIVPLELQDIDMKNYQDAEGEFREWLENNKTTMVQEQEQLEKLKQLAYLAKRNSMLKWIDDFLSTGEKLVVMAYHTMAIDDIFSKFRNVAVRLDGKTSQSDRQVAIDRFQNDPNVKLFVGQIQAAGVGITLTAASSLAFAEFTFTPADHLQAEDRIHRIGQNAEMVNIYYLVGVSTVDEKMAKMIDHKNNVVSKIVDGKENKEFFGQENIMEDLIKSYKEAEK